MYTFCQILSVPRLLTPCNCVIITIYIHVICYFICKSQIYAYQHANMSMLYRPPYIGPGTPRPKTISARDSSAQISLLRVAAVLYLYCLVKPVSHQSCGSRTPVYKHILGNFVRQPQDHLTFRKVARLSQRRMENFQHVHFPNDF